MGCGGYGKDGGKEVSPEKVISSVNRVWHMDNGVVVDIHPQGKNSE